MHKPFQGILAILFAVVTVPLLLPSISGTRVDVSCSTEEVDFTYAGYGKATNAFGVHHLRTLGDAGNDC